jgi:hypothetical protein
MKVIFSRKGVDSAAGQCASALVGNRPISLPIPTREPTPATYCQLNRELSWMARDLSRGALAGTRPCHLDPDIDRDALATRPQGWRGALGQVSSSLSHLRNQGVGPGDLFLFWGLYRPVAMMGGVWGYCGPRQHAMFGWLHVEAVCEVGNDGTEVLRRYPWLAAHPHVRPGWSGANAVYLASEWFNLAGRKLPGSGVFRHALRLTEPGECSPSVWAVPSWLDVAAGGVGFSYHPPGRWLGGGRLRSAARGQEFVADITGRADAASWIADMLEAHR